MLRVGNMFLLKIYGPAQERALFDRGPQEELLLTDFSRSCCRLWLALHGRRFSVYRTQKKKLLRGRGKAVKLLQHDGFDALEQEAIEDEAPSRSAGDAQAVPPDARATFAGLPRAQLHSSGSDRIRNDWGKRKQRMEIGTEFTTKFHRCAGGQEMPTPA